MTTFLQCHFLTSYPAANLNRDDTGRPKSMRYGGVNRLRVSSQSMKRAWRTSDLFETEMAGHIGKRSTHFATELFDALLAKGMDEKKAVARIIELIKAQDLGAPKKVKGEGDIKKAIQTEQLVHLGPNELQALLETADALADESVDDKALKKLPILSKADSAVDVAMFGRMLASHPAQNVEAACQVAHAFTTHMSTSEDDFFTAVDDLKNDSEDADAGAGHLGIVDFGAGVFYNYVCISADLLLENLNGDVALAKKSVATLIEAMAKVSPTGKQNTFASRARAGYMLLETGNAAPHSHADAFLKPVKGGSDLMVNSIDALTKQKHSKEAVYGDENTTSTSFDVTKAQGSLQGIIDHATAAFDEVAK